MDTNYQPTQVPFFCAEPHALFLKNFLKQDKLGSVFSVAEEGDFILNLLSFVVPKSVYVCGVDPKHAMTVEVKKNLLGKSNWKTLEETFHGPKGIGRLHKLGHWMPENFSQIKHMDYCLNYLSDVKAYVKLKRQLAKIEIDHGNVNDHLQKFEPEAFDLIYLGRALDQPGLYSMDNWPETVSSRLSPDGLAIVVTGQNKKFVANQMQRIGFKVHEPVTIKLPYNVYSPSFLVLSVAK